MSAISVRTGTIRCVEVSCILPAPSALARHSSAVSSEETMITCLNLFLAYARDCNKRESTEDSLLHNQYTHVRMDG